MTCCLDIAVITSKVRSNSRLLLRSLLNACNDISVYHCCVGISYTKGSFNFSDWDNVNVTYIDIITKWLLVENSELRLIFEGMSFITLFKAINREPFPVCWYRFPKFRGYIYKGKFDSVESYFWSMKIPLEAYLALYLCRLETVLRES